MKQKKFYYREKKMSLNFSSFCIINFLFEAITTFRLPLLLNLFKYILKVNYVAA